MNKQIEKLMKNLGISEAEAVQLIADDKEIDKGKDLFPLSVEQKKVVKEMSKTGTRKTPTLYKFEDGRQVKANPTKEGIVKAVCDFLVQSGYENVTITNKNRQISFSTDGKNFEWTLVEKRQKKGG